MQAAPFLRVNVVMADCLEHLRTMPSGSVDSLITDPPAGISFMGKAWDDDKGGRLQWVAWLTEVMGECLRVLKPGAHGLVWCLPRTSHWTMSALEDAGFEVRDVITHLFGTGFPKSHNLKGEWQGWGTALKPAAEFWVLVRKPLGEKTVASNVLKHGTGAVNIDASRIEASDVEALAKNWDRTQSECNKSGTITREGGDLKAIDLRDRAPTGRFPSNVVLSHSEGCGETCEDGCAVAALDRQSGTLKSGDLKPYHNKVDAEFSQFHSSFRDVNRPGDSGGASRFFYCAKASRKDRGEGNKHPTVKSTQLMDYLIKLVTPPGGTVLDPFMGSGSTGVAAKRSGFEFVGIEMSGEYFETALQRLS